MCFQLASQSNHLQTNRKRSFSSSKMSHTDNPEAASNCAAFSLFSSLSSDFTDLCLTAEFSFSCSTFSLRHVFTGDFFFPLCIWKRAWLHLWDPTNPKPESLQLLQCVSDAGSEPNTWSDICLHICCLPAELLHKPQQLFAQLHRSGWKHFVQMHQYGRVLCQNYSHNSNKGEISSTLDSYFHSSRFKCKIWST